MTKSDIIELALQYHRVSAALQRHTGDEAIHDALLNQRHGIKLACIALEVWYEVEAAVADMVVQGMR